MSFPFIKETSDGVYLAIKLQPRSSRNKIGNIVGNELKIYVTAPPVDSAANEALINLLAEKLECPPRTIHLIKGQTCRNKTLFLQGMKASDIVQTFKVWLEC